MTISTINKYGYHEYCSKGAEIITTLEVNGNNHIMNSSLIMLDYFRKQNGDLYYEFIWTNNPEISIWEITYKNHGDGEKIIGQLRTENIDTHLRYLHAFNVTSEKIKITATTERTYFNKLFLPCIDFDKFNEKFPGLIT